MMYTTASAILQAAIDIAKWYDDDNYAEIEVIR